MKALKIILTLFFVFSTLLFSCEDVGQCGPVLPYFEIQGLKSTNLKFTNTSSNLSVPIEASELVNWKDYFIRTTFDVKYQAFEQERKSGGANLYALSCVPEGHAGSKVGLDTLYIVTLNDYNSNYKANDTINKIILLNEWTYSLENYNQFKSPAQYIQENNKSVKAKTFEIKFNEKPGDASSEQKFKIIYKLNNGRTFDVITSSVKLNL